MLQEIDPAKVLALMTEYDRIGEVRFLSKHEGSRAKRYYVAHPSNLAKIYPSKVIAKAALGWDDINGGYSTNFSACKMLERAGFAIVDSTTATVAQDIKAAFDSLSESEREAIVLRRVGQSALRARLLELRGGECEITSMSDTLLLRASHIKPWVACASTKERCDPDNAILLSPLWDAAFDAGLTSFDDEGDPLYSSQLSSMAKRSLAKGIQSTLWPSKEQCGYLAWHRQHIFRP